MLYQHENGVRFRRVESSDLADLAELKGESWFGTHRVSLVSMASQRKWLDSLDAEDVHAPRNVALIASDDNALAFGVFKILDIDWQSRRACVGWDVYREHRGQGFGKKLVAAGVGFCFNFLNLHRLQADILATNAASLKCAQAAGFKSEGYQPKAVLRLGKWVDNVIYGILAPEPK